MTTIILNQGSIEKQTATHNKPLLNEIGGEMKSTIKKLQDLFGRFEKETKREYGGDWKDWEPSRTTGGQKHPCVYCLWQEGSQENPSYVGETVDLGKRLWDHDKATGWSDPKWKFVQYVSDELLEDGEFRQLFECFCIYILKPKDNNIKRKPKGTI